MCAGKAMEAFVSHWTLIPVLVVADLLGKASNTVTHFAVFNCSKIAMKIPNENSLLNSETETLNVIIKIIVGIR